MSKELGEEALNEPKTINKVVALVYNYKHLRQAEDLRKILSKHVAIAYSLKQADKIKNILLKHWNVH